MITTTCKKGVQAINYFARKKDGKINKMKAIKLVYFADRYHLRKYGRPVIGDVYWAMKFGPVASTTLRVADLAEVLPAECLSYAKENISHPKGDIKLNEIISRKEVDLNVFSQTDIEALENAYNEFGDKDQFELADITHNYPEWSKFKSELTNTRKRAKMDYIDFFKDPKDPKTSLFNIHEEQLNLSREVFLENREIEEILA